MTGRHLRLDAIRMFRDWRIETAPEHHKHFRHGWVGVRCPFCAGSEGFHLGYSLSGGYFNCYRCGWKPAKKALAAILGVIERKIPEAVAPYIVKSLAGEPPDEEQHALSQVGLPPPLPPTASRPLRTAHRRYLERRGFSPEELEAAYGLLSTGPGSWPGWNWRIVAPIFYHGRMVSYQARTISDSVAEKYRACPASKETLHHKKVLYGLDNCRGEGVIVVEGITDVWRLGAGSVATFGVKTTSPQRALLQRSFKRIFILYDSDENEAGQSAGEELAWRLSAGGSEVLQIFLPNGDPAAMSEAESRMLKRDLLGLS